MSEQAWQRRPAGGGAPSRAAPAASKSPSSASRAAAARSRGADRVSSAMAPTAASNGKKIASKQPSAEEGEASRWRALRQSVHVRATVDASARTRQTARIADLCEEDRDKVAQLIRRVVEIGTIHEESEAAFSRERAMLRSEIDQLRAQARRDAAEIDELGDKLRSTLLSLRGHQERVLALEESSDAETRAWHEVEQTMDMLRAEVEKLRLLVRRQRDEMAAERRREQERFQAELHEMSEQLRAAQSQLIQEREEWIAEKQRELDARLQEQAESEKHARDSASLRVEGTKPDSEDKVVGPADQPAACSGAVRQKAPPSALDISSFLNTSVELPETIRTIMDDWKERMEEAISGIASVATAPIASTSGRQAPAGGSDADASQTNRSANRQTLTVDRHTPSNGVMRSEGAVEAGKANDRAHTLINEDGEASEESASEYEASSSSDPGDTRRVHAVKRLDFDVCSSSAQESSRSDVSDGGRLPGKASDRSHLRKSRRQNGHKQGTQRSITKPSGRRSSRTRHRYKQPVTASNGTRQLPQTAAQQRVSRSVSSSEEDWTSESESERRRRLRRRERHRSRATKAPVTEEHSLHDRGIGIGQIPPDSSFGSLYETSLFEVVDAIESVRARDEDAQPRHQEYGHVEARHTPVVAPILPEAAVDDSRARVDRLKEHMEARERKLAAHNRIQETPRAISSARSATQVNDGRDIDDEASVDDFEVFNAVKDLYSREVFASGRPFGDPPLPSWKTRLSDGDDGGFTDEGGGHHWPAYSNGVATALPGVPTPRHGTQQEIREAIEVDIEALLREGPLVHDLFLSG